jgi:archaemetzincin
MRVIRLVAALLIGVCFFACSDKKPITVGIQPFDNFDTALADTVSILLRKTYGVSVYILNRRPIPQKAFINIKSPRYRADEIIRILKNEKPDSINYVLSLTNNDISASKKDWMGKIKQPKTKYADWGIFGFGYRPGPTCVVSTFRLKSAGEQKLVERLKKICVHELGHNFGLDHCDSELCAMKDAAETIRTIDFVQAALCEKCRKKINLR